MTTGSGTAIVEDITSHLHRRNASHDQLPRTPATRRAERGYYQLAIALVVLVTVTTATSTIKDLKDGNYVDMAAGFAVTIIAVTVVEFLIGALKRR